MVTLLWYTNLFEKFYTYKNHEFNSLQEVMTFRPWLKPLIGQYYKFNSKNLRAFINKGLKFLETNNNNMVVVIERNLTLFIKVINNSNSTRKNNLI